MMQKFPRKGTAIVMCAPSGAGKTTLAKRLLARYDRFDFSISCTTRQPRPGEVNGVDYTFLSEAEFFRLRDQNFFAEWALVHGNYYGTPLAAANKIIEQGRDILFDIDVQGAKQLKVSIPNAYFIFIMPPSRAELEKRLLDRGSETAEAIALRLENAVAELREAHWFDTWVFNHDQEKAFQDLCSAYRAACMSPARRPEFLANLLEQFK